VNLRWLVRPIVANPQTEDAIRALHERSADYVMRIWGLPPDPRSGREFFARLPHAAGTVKSTAIVLMKPLERAAA